MSMNAFDVLREKLELRKKSEIDLSNKMMDIDRKMSTAYANKALAIGDVIELVNQVEQEFAPKTNADMIRSMTDEQLADEMLKFPDVCEQAGFCKNDILCNDTLDRGETIEPEMCKRCLMNWLKKEVKE